MEKTHEPYRYQVSEPAHVSELAAAIGRETNDLPQAQRQAAAERLAAFRRRWAECFARYGQDPAGELAFRDLLLGFEEDIAPHTGAWPGAGQSHQALERLRPALAMAPPPASVDPQKMTRQRRIGRRHATDCEPPRFDRALFILSPPRSGSTLLFETLAALPELWTTGEESHGLIEGIPALHPAAHGYASNRLTAEDATPPVVAALHRRFARQLQDRTGRAYVERAPEERPAQVRLLEKTPKNILRIPFLRAAFPGARFLVLYRRPEETLASMLEGWRSRRFESYRPLPGWPYRAWKFLLVPGWETLAHRPLAEIVAHQWRMAYQTLLADLRDLPQDAWLPVRYADLVAEPVQSIRRIAGFAGLASDAHMEGKLAEGLPLSSMAFSAPNSEKWRKHAEALETVLPGLQDTVAAIERSMGD